MHTLVSGSALQVAISSSCHDNVAPSSVVGRFLLQARQPAMLSAQSIAQRRHFLAIIKDILVCVVLGHVPHCSAFRIALYKCLLTYLLTYWKLGRVLNGIETLNL